MDPSSGTLCVEMEYDSACIDLSMERQPRTFRILEVYDVSLSQDAARRLRKALLRDSPISHLVLFPPRLVNRASPRTKIALSDEDIKALVRDKLAPPRILDRLAGMPAYLGGNVWSILGGRDSSRPADSIAAILRGKPSSLRISCGSMCRIRVEKNYLLGLNETRVRRGANAFTPIGGGIRVSSPGRECLENLLGRMLFERSGEEQEGDWLDLRFTFRQPDKEKLGEFLSWFYRSRETGEREKDPTREIIEELATDDGHHVKALDPNGIHFTLRQQWETGCHHCHQHSP